MDIMKHEGVPSKCVFGSLEYPWRLKFSCGAFGRVSFLQRITLQKKRGRDVSNVVSVAGMCQMLFLWQGCVK
jgi:hypothetical protein